MLQTEINLISCKYRKFYDHPLCATCYAPQFYTCTQCFNYRRASIFQDQKKKNQLQVYKHVNRQTKHVYVYSIIINS